MFRVSMALCSPESKTSMTIRISPKRGNGFHNFAVIAYNMQLDVVFLPPSNGNDHVTEREAPLVSLHRVFSFLILFSWCSNMTIGILQREEDLYTSNPPISVVRFGLCAPSRFVGGVYHGEPLSSLATSKVPTYFSSLITLSSSPSSFAAAAIFCRFWLFPSTPPAGAVSEVARFFFFAAACRA